MAKLLPPCRPSARGFGRHPRDMGTPYLLPLHGGQGRREASRPGGVHAILGQCKGLLHAEAGEGRVEVAAVQAHGGGHGALNGAAAALPGVFAAVSVGRLPEKEERVLSWGCCLALSRWQQDVKAGHTLPTASLIFLPGSW